MTPEWVILSGISAQAQALYTVLVAHVSRSREDNYVWPGMDVLASILGYRRRQTLKPYLSELTGVGALDITEVRDAQGYRHNVYTVHEIAPDGYAGMRSLEEFYDQRRPEKVPMYARAHQAKSAGAHQAMCGTAHMNKTDATRQSEGSSHSRGGSTSSPERSHSRGGSLASSTSRRDQPQAEPIVLNAPAEFYDTAACNDGEAHRWLVKAATSAMRTAGAPMATGARDRIGAAVKARAATGRTRAVLLSELTAALNRAVGGDPEFAWMTDPTNVRPPRPNFKDLAWDANPDEPEEGLGEVLYGQSGDVGTWATVYSMGATHHPNAIANTVRARAQ
jgi:hypothetical protein